MIDSGIPLLLEEKSYLIYLFRFDSVGKIRAKTRGILNLTKDGDKITGKDHDFVILRLILA